MATFAGFAVIGVAFFQFGVGIAIDRASPWEAYLRTLPVGPAVRLAARLVSAAVFACAAAALLVVDSRRHDRRLAPGGALGRARPSRLLAGVVPFAFLGIALGYWAPAKGALPIANLLYLVLAYAGGLWILPSRPSGGRRRRSPGFLPTRALSDALVAAARGAPRRLAAVAGARRLRRRRSPCAAVAGLPA